MRIILILKPIAHDNEEENERLDDDSTLDKNIYDPS